MLVFRVPDRARGIPIRLADRDVNGALRNMAIVLTYFALHLLVQLPRHRIPRFRIKDWY